MIAASPAQLPPLLPVCLTVAIPPPPLPNCHRPLPFSVCSPAYNYARYVVDMCGTQPTTMPNEDKGMNGFRQICHHNYALLRQMCHLLPQICYHKFDLLRQICHRIFISKSDAAVPTTMPDEATSETTCDEIYIALSGDTCPSIAHQHELTIEELCRLNPRLDCDKLDVGQQVCVAG